MRYNDYENEYEEKQKKKIPYDKEPIVRQTNYNKKARKSSGGGASSKSLTFVVCILVALNLILSGLVVSVLKDNKNGGVNNTTVNITSTSTVDVSAVTSKAKLSAVCIGAGYTTDSTEKPNYQGLFKMQSKGAGVIFDGDKEDGVVYIVTCYHVVKGYSKQVYVLLHDSLVPEYATLVGYSSVYDTAVLKIENSNEYKKSASRPCDVADSAMCILGEAAIAIGNPQAMGFSVTSGVVSGLNDLVPVDGVVRRTLRTSAAINGGNSGGGLFNAQGELIGIVTAKALSVPSQNNYIDNMAYATPSNVAISLAKNIVRNTRPRKVVIGLELWADADGLTDDVINGELITKQKVVVNSIDANSVAYKAGFKQYDQIVAFAYGDTVVNVTNTFSFEDHAFAISKGDKVKFFIERGGVPQEITLTIEDDVDGDNQNWFN